ncbi:MAG: hypothetical protein ABI972_31965 [Acidobacteriota bacterium]
MRNVFAALVGLLMSSAVLPAQDGGNDASVAVYLKLGDDSSARAIQHMKKEVAQLLRPTGVKIHWRMISDARLHEEFQSVVVARFEGSCTTAYDAFAPVAARKPAPLADTPVQDGHVLPFTRVDCAAVTRLTGPMLAGEAGARRDFLYGRALGRVLAHEIYHILGQTKTHEDKGIAKPAFHARELLSEVFAFNEPAISVLRAGTRESVPASDDVAGR